MGTLLIMFITFSFHCHEAHINLYRSKTTIFNNKRQKLLCSVHVVGEFVENWISIFLGCSFARWALTNSNMLINNPVSGKARWVAGCIGFYMLMKQNWYGNIYAFLISIMCGLIIFYSIMQTFTKNQGMKLCSSLKEGFRVKLCFHMLEGTYSYFASEICNEIRWYQHVELSNFEQKANSKQVHITSCLYINEQSFVFLEILQQIFSSTDPCYQNVIA